MGTPSKVGLAPEGAGPSMLTFRSRQDVAVGSGNHTTSREVEVQGVILVDEDGVPSPIIGSSFTTRLDYAGRSDSNPVYIGTGPLGSIDNTDDSSDWLIKKLEYDGSSRVTSIKVIRDAAWSNRAALVYQ